MEELWKEYTYGNLKYLVSNYGRVIGLGRNKEIKQRLNKDGYVEVTMGDLENRSRVRIHRVVALLFVDNPNNLKEVNHIDRNRANPRADNLEWVTHQENIKHSHNQGAYREIGRGVKNPKCKLTEEQVYKIREMFKEGCTKEELVSKFGVSKSTIDSIVNNRTWKHLL